MKTALWMALSALLGCAACDRPAPAAHRYAPSSDPGIELAKFEDRDWIGKGARIVLAFQRGHYSEGWSGFHVDADGSVWEFEYAPPKRDASTGCDVADLKPGSADALRCKYQNSNLIARLAPEATKEFLQSASTIVDEGRIGGTGGKYEAGDVLLELDGYGTHDGKPIVVAGCSAREQLVSKEAQFLVRLFHRVGHLFPKFAMPKAACGSPRFGDEVAPGVPGWWVH